MYVSNDLFCLYTANICALFSIPNLSSVFSNSDRSLKKPEYKDGDRSNLTSVKHSYNKVVNIGVIMLTGIKQKAVVGKNGKIELSATELPEGTIVEVIVLVEPSTEEDETTYLLKSEANKKHLLKAMENVEKGNLIYVDLDEYEKNHL